MQGPLAVSATLSHEVLETIGDPYINWWADTPDGDEEAIELCDRVEGDAYAIGNVSVSNFLGPRAFSMGAGPYDRLGLLANAWDMTAGGYKIRRQGGPSGTVTQVFGAKMPAWKRALVKASRRHQRRLRRAA